MLVVLVGVGGVAVAETLNGMGGNDRFVGGYDRIWVFNRPAAKDLVNCDRGFDRVEADSQDVLEDCNGSGVRRINRIEWQSPNNSGLRRSLFSWLRGVGSAGRRIPSDYSLSCEVLASPSSYLADCMTRQVN
jgi:hypothetical protein